MTHKLREVDAEKYAYYVNKLRQNVGLETWTWRQIVTSQRAHTKYKWPSYDTEWIPHEIILRTPLSLTEIRDYFSNESDLRVRMINYWNNTDRYILFKKKSTEFCK